MRNVIVIVAADAAVGVAIAVTDATIAITVATAAAVTGGVTACLPTPGRNKILLAERTPRVICSVQPLVYALFD